MGSPLDNPGPIALRSTDQPMLCPKCGHDNSAGEQACARCGVIFARIRPPAPAAGISLAERCAEVKGSSATPRRSLELVDLGRALLLLGLLIWSARLILAGFAGNAAGESLLHLVNLPFHEAGHVFFRPFGRFMTSFGGSLLQLLVPLICGATLLLKNRDPFGAAVCTWWFGENFLDLAPYIGDARAGVLPLVGGNFGHSSPYGFHDWEYLLTETGLLRHDLLLAKLAHGGGALVMLAALILAGGLAYRRFRER